MNNILFNDVTDYTNNIFIAECKIEHIYCL